MEVTTRTPVVISRAPERETLKRAFDICFSLAAIVALSPVLLITMLAIKLEDGGPIFYRSERIGRNGLPFLMWKFRSMAVDADRRVDDLIKLNGGSALLFKMKDDPRVTRVGRIIRKFSIDELPQLFNALGGTMSIVGPRPQVQREVDEYAPEMFGRLAVPPGITGLWQVSGRSNLCPSVSKALDLYYAKHRTFLLDLSILAATLRAVLQSDGAY